MNICEMIVKTAKKVCHAAAADDVGQMAVMWYLDREDHPGVGPKIDNAENKKSAIYWLVRRCYREVARHNKSVILTPERNYDDPIKCDGELEAEYTPESDELFEEILICCKDSKDRRIIQLKKEGYKNVEIAKDMGISDSSVSLRIKAIESRLAERH
jgi:RNA polymerase sigma factor (sigma-70 family)